MGSLFVLSLVLLILTIQFTSTICGENTAKRQIGSKLRHKGLHSVEPLQQRILPCKQVALGSNKNDSNSLMKIRSLFFLFYGTLGCCLPFFPVFFGSIGVPRDFIGFLGSITPAITFIVSPLWGVLADMTGKYRFIMLSTFILSVIGRCALSLPFFTENLLAMGGIVALTAVLNAPVKPLMDAAIMDNLDDKTDYGKSRLYGQLGFGIGSFAVGPLLAGNMNNIFTLHAGLAIPTALLMSTLAISNSDSGVTENRSKTFSVKPKKVAGSLRMVLSQPDILMFFLGVFVIGLASGVIENFAYVRISDVGGTGKELGLCRLLSSVAGGPMFWLSGRIAQKIGVNTILMLTFASYVIRFWIYASLTHPLQAIPAEILRGVMWATFWACATYHVYQVAPEGTTATMLGLLNGVYGGLGQSVGALVGGLMVKKYGIPEAFYRASIAQAGFALCFFLHLIVTR